MPFANLDKMGNLSNTSITMSGRNTAVVSISLPQEILEQITRWAKLENKSKTELIKEAWELYRTWKIKKNLKHIRRLGEETRKKFGFKTEDELFEYIHSE